MRSLTSSRPALVAVEHDARRDRVEMLFRALVPGDRDQPVEYVRIMLASPD